MLGNEIAGELSAPSGLNSEDKLDVHLSSQFHTFRALKAQKFKWKAC